MGHHGGPHSFTMLALSQLTTSASCHHLHVAPFFSWTVLPYCLVSTPVSTYSHVSVFVVIMASKFAANTRLANLEPLLVGEIQGRFAVSL
jgi:hypothetical protein